MTSQPMHVAPVLAVKDLETSREFYEGKLGLEGEEAPGGWIVRGQGDTLAYLLPGIDSAGSAIWPVASFRVEDVHAKVKELREVGVDFLGPDDVPFELDEDGVSAQDGISVAWMQDPDGSVLTVFSLT